MISRVELRGWPVVQSTMRFDELTNYLNISGRIWDLIGDLRKRSGHPHITP